MKRYSLGTDTGLGVDEYDGVNGEWVRHEDAIAELQELEEWRARVTVALYGVGPGAVIKTAEEAAATAHNLRCGYDQSEKLRQDLEERVRKLDGENVILKKEVESLANQIVELTTPRPVEPAIDDEDARRDERLVEEVAVKMLLAGMEKVDRMFETGNGDDTVEALNLALALHKNSWSCARNFVAARRSSDT